MGGEVRPALGHRGDLAQAVGEEAQGPLRGDARIELAHRTGRRVARVDEGLAADLALAFVEPVEIGTAHIDLAAHLQHRRHAAFAIRGQGERDLADGADVVGHVLAHLAVAARGGLHQPAVLVAQAHGEAVELGLGHVFDGRRIGRQLQLAAHAGVEGLGAAGLGVGLGANAEHGHLVAHGRKALHHRADHALRGRIGCDQIRVGRLQRLQGLEGAVVFRIGHAGRVHHVVLVRPEVQPGAQRFDFNSSLPRWGGRWIGKKVLGFGHGRRNLSWVGHPGRWAMGSAPRHGRRADSSASPASRGSVRAPSAALLGRRPWVSAEQAPRQRGAG